MTGRVFFAMLTFVVIIGGIMWFLVLPAVSGVPKPSLP